MSDVCDRSSFQIQPFFGAALVDILGELPFSPPEECLETSINWSLPLSPEISLLFSYTK
jgi:hypothetical protein